MRDRAWNCRPTSPRRRQAGGIGRSGKGAVHQVLVDDAHRARRPGPVRPFLHVVAAGGERGKSIRGKAAFQVEPAGKARVGLEGVGEFAGGETRGFHRDLRVHVENHDVEQGLEHGLHLNVPTGRAERHHETSRRDGQRRIGSEARAFAGSDSGGVGGLRPGLRASRGRAEPGAGYDRRVVGDVARRGGEGISMPVDDRDIGGVARCRRLAGDGCLSGVRFIHIEGAVETDSRALALLVFAREQAFEGHIDESGVPVVALSIGERELQCLDHGVHVVDRVVPHVAQLGRAQEGQGLGQRRSLAPWPADVDFHAFEVEAYRLLHPNAELGQVFGTEESVVLPVVAQDGARDVSAVESPACRLQPGLPSSTRRRALLIGHVLEARREIRLNEAFSGPWRPAAGKVYLGVARPAGVVPFVRGDDVRHVRVHHDAFSGEADRGGRDVGEAHGAMALERGDPGVRSRGDYGAKQARRNVSPVAALEVVRSYCPRPAPQPAYDLHPSLVREIHHDRGHPRDVHVLAVHHAQRDSTRHPRVHRVAARFENLKGGLGRKVVSARHHVPLPANERPEAVHVRGIGAAARIRGAGIEAERFLSGLIHRHCRSPFRERGSSLLDDPERGPVAGGGAPAGEQNGR